MKKIKILFSICFIGALGIVLSSFQDNIQSEDPLLEDIAALRAIYSKDPSQWPKPHVDSAAKFKELGIMPKSIAIEKADSLKHLIKLGRVLFHDPRLSASNQISCGTCHVPDLNWADGRAFAKGHDHQIVPRNTPTIENISMNTAYFWDGKANTLEEQAPHSIANPLEMNMDLKKLPKKLSKIKGYQAYFKDAYGDKKITMDRIAEAIAMYERSIVVRKSEFDKLISGEKNKMSDEAVKGLHLFRTKARCINCHNGPAFTDNQFHNMGLTYYGREKYEDWGRYHISKNVDDIGKFKTPTLRGVMYTNPWFHNGLFDDIDGVLNMYNAGMPTPKKTKVQEEDPLFPNKSALLKELNLSKEERDAIVAFLWSISVKSVREEQPVLPK